MAEDEPGRVQEMPPGRESDEPAATATTVRVIADHRMPNRREMHANLVRAARVQMRAQQIGGIEARETDEIRPRRAAGGDDGHPLAIARIARERLVDRQPIDLEMPP